MSSRTAASIAAGVTAVAVVYTVALLMGVNDPDWAYLARPIIHLGEFTAVVALGLSGAAGPGRLGRIGIGAAALGTLVLAVAEVVYESSSAVGEALFGVGPTLVGIGLILAGVAVVRTALWNGWQRYITLVLGIYIFVVMTPVLTPLAALPAVHALWALAGWQVLWVLIAVAVLAQTSAERRTLAPAVS